MENMKTNILILPLTKKCTGCNEHKELCYFGKDKWQANGLKCRCKDCLRMERRSYVAKNRDMVNAKHRDWLKKNEKAQKLKRQEYLEANAAWIKPLHQKQAKKRYLANIDVMRERKRNEYAKHKEKIKETREKYRNEANYDKTKHALLMWYNIRSRCNKSGIECTMLASDIVIPEYCPALGIKLVRGSGMNGASVDRIDPKKGYTHNNIIVISRLANMIKTCATPEQILSVGNFYKRLMESRNE